MSFLKFAIVGALFAAGFSTVYAGADSTLDADKQQIDTACASDSATANCGGEQVGGGLLRCLHAYRKSHPTYSFTPACKAAMHQLHADKKAGK